MTDTEPTTVTINAPNTNEQENTPINIDTLINTTSKSHKKSASKKSRKPPKPKKSILAEQQRLIELLENVEQKYLDLEYQQKQQQLKQQHELQQQQSAQQHIETQQLLSELSVEQPAIIDRSTAIQKIEHNLYSTNEWQNYIACYYNLPQINIQSELHTYCTLYNELYGDTTHNIYLHPEQYIQEILNSVSVIEQLNILLLHEYNNIRLLNCSTQQHSNNTQLYYYWQYKNKLRTIAYKHMDLLTQCILYQCDRLESQEARTVNFSAFSNVPVQINNELSTLYHCIQSEAPEYSAVSYGIWIHNSSKHGRVKRIEFTNIGIQLELPVAFQKNRTSLRVIRMNCDCTSDQRYHTGVFAYNPLVQGYNQHSEDKYSAEQIKSNTYHFVSVGGIINIEQLALPAPVKRAKGWTLKEHMTHNDSVTVVPYPAVTDNDTVQTSSHAPLRIQYTLSDTLYLDEREPHYGYWDNKQHSWKQDGITLTKFDPIKRSVNITLNVLKPFAIIQPRALDFPYRYWSIHNVDNNIHIGVQGSRFTVTVSVVQDKTQLVSPVSTVLHTLNHNLYSPADLLSQLCATGINVMPTVADILYCRKPQKSMELLHTLHIQLALVLDCFAVDSCIVSSNVDCNSAVFRVKLLHNSTALNESVQKRDEYDAEHKVNEPIIEPALTGTDIANTLQHSSSTASIPQSVASIKISDNTTPVQPERILPPLDERIAQGYEYVHVLATLTTVNNTTDTQNTEQTAESNEPKSNLIKFVVVNGIDHHNADKFDLAPIPGQIVHSSLRRCVYTYFNELTEHALDMALNMRVRDSIEFIPYTKEQLLHQQTVTHTLNLLNPFTFH